MDTLSSPVTTFQVPKPLNPNHHSHLKPTPVSHHHHHSSVKTTATSSVSKTKPPSSTTSYPQKVNFTPLYPRNYPPKPSSALPPLSLTSKPPRDSVHRGAASGYAAALLDTAQCNGAVLEVARDVKRLLRLLRNGQVQEFMMDEHVEDRAKGDVVKELVEKGKFEGHLVGLVKMVIGKGKRVGIVREVLEEFDRIFYHLTHTLPLPPSYGN